MSIRRLLNYIKENMDTVGSSYSTADDRLANLGGEPGDVFSRDRGNEYNGLAVKLLERVYPLYTVQTVSTIARLVESDEYMKALSMMGLESVEELEYALYMWAVAAIGTPPADEVPKPKVVERADLLDSRVRLIKHDPIDCRLEVVDIGYNSTTKSSAVPEDWLGRVFENGEQMHRAMDEFRPGKPPTTYAVIYSMTKREQSDILDLSGIPDSAVVWLIDEDCTVQDVDRAALGTADEYSYIRLSDTEYVGFILDRHFTARSTAVTTREYVTEYGEQIQTLSSGVLSSMMQKAIRRGCADLVEEVLLILNEKPNYNLPDMGFIRVSSSRQCTWRLYISALEDVTYYVCDDSAVSLLGLVLLSLVAQRLLDYRYSDSTMKLICSTARRLCNTTVHTPFNNIKGTDSTEDPALTIALDYMPMMASDKKMLEKYLLLDENRYAALSTDIENRVDSAVLLDTILSSFDHHCRPDIVLVYQSLLPTVLTTRDTSKYIWDKSSAVNYRRGEQPDLSNSNVALLRDIQDMLYWQGMPNSKEDSPYVYSTDESRQLPISEADRREAFLVLFGRSYRKSGIDYMIAGTADAPIKYKTKGNNKSPDRWIHTTDTTALQYFPSTAVDLRTVRAPLGYSWVADRVTAEYSDGQFIAILPDSSRIVVPLFDGSVLLRAVAPVVDKDQGHSSHAFQLVGHTVDDILEYRLGTNDRLQYLRPQDYDRELVILTYTKLFNRVGSEPVSIGPIDRKGNRTEKSINLEYEGRLWYIFSYLSWLYPTAIRMSGTLKFTVDTSSPEYVLLIEGLREMLYSSDLTPSVEQYSVPTIRTVLWPHQQTSVDTMYNMMYVQGAHGAGDASDVGAGKTLTALALGSRLIGTEQIQGYRGILVLVPNKSLIESWINEVQKHTDGYDVLVHTAKSKVTADKVKRNSIVISALNTMRDHPIQNPWILTVIDECLSVQNSSAQWTEEAWKQTLISRHVVLLSATFFRSRYNKLYYMLSMLQSVLPNSIEYLPTILNERIIVHKELSTGREWHTNTTYIPFPEDIREQYDSILYDSGRGDQEKYGLLQQLLNSKRQYVAEYLRTEILNGLPEDRRAVLYTAGNDEAKLFSTVLGIPIYGSKGTDPKNCRHIIATLSKAAVGVNDLVHFNTVIMRPPPPDLLPQIKGRLDRPGQQHTDLYMEYFMIDESIDLGLEVRMNIANNFLSTYIMPLAEFYTASIRASTGTEEL